MIENFRIKLLENYKETSNSLHSLLKEIHVNSLNKKGIDEEAIKLTFLDPTNLKYNSYNGLFFSVPINENLFKKYQVIPIESIDQHKEEFKLYEKFISNLEVPNFIENIRLFTEGIYDEVDFSKIKKNTRSMFFNIENITALIKKTYEENFFNKGYILKGKVKRNIVFEKALSFDHNLNICYDENTFKTDLKLDHLRLPKLTVWIFNKVNKKEAFLGFLEHPFNLGMINPENYLANTLMVKMDKETYQFISPVKIMQTGKEIIIESNKELENKLKKCIFLYLSIQLEFIESVIDFYEGVAKEIIKTPDLNVARITI